MNELIRFYTEQIRLPSIQEAIKNKEEIFFRRVKGQSTEAKLSKIDYFSLPEDIKQLYDKRNELTRRLNK